MRKNIIPLLFITAILGILVSSCSDFLDPKPDNRFTLDDVIANPGLAEGWLLKAYKNLPSNYNFNEDFASDDAVTNDQGSNIISMNNGGWNASNNPIGIWDKAYEMNLYLNTFLTYVDTIQWSWVDTRRDSLYHVRLKAEAYGLRAWWNFLLLQKHGGIGTNGELLGFPIVNHILGTEENLELPRDSYAACVQYILSDCDSAIAGLPLRWADVAEDDIFNGVMGARYKNRINGLAALILKSRVALTAASPAFNSESGVTWEDAAQYAADVITANNGLGGLKASDVEFFLDYKSNEIFWSSSKTDNTNGWEKDNFPPSLFGGGEVNPSQNLIESFPMANGVPISVAGLSGYDPLKPYVARDPRLYKYIIFNGSYMYIQDVDTAFVHTHLNAELDGINVGIKSTRSGYYLKKFMNPKVKLDPSGTIVGAEHFYTYARYTEALLNYAEAANEAYGPDVDPGIGFTPRQVVSAIRVRAGFPALDLDTYLKYFVTSQSKLRDLIYAERRIELCFEGFRFWDIRRLNNTVLLGEDVLGIEISEDQSVFETMSVEPRNYVEYNIYGPIPYIETIKYDLIQNLGYE